MVDIARALRTALESGEVRLGSHQVRRAVSRGEAKLVIVAQGYEGENLGEGKVKVHHFEGSNVELGAACGKPFSISSLAVVDPGKSNILSL